MFTINFGEYEFFLPKNSVRFVNDLGYVSTIININNVNVTLVGVVDSNFQPIVPLIAAKVMPKIFIGPNKNIICSYYEGDRLIIIHRKEDGTIVSLGSGEFFVIDKDQGIVVLDYDNCIALYDSLHGEYLTPFYSVIGPFIESREFGCKVARASYYVQDNNEVIRNELSTIISSTGEVLAPFYDLVTGKEYPCSHLIDAIHRSMEENPIRK